MGHTAAEVCSNHPWGHVIRPSSPPINVAIGDV